MKSYAIAAIPGDGIGKEVLPEGVRVLEAVGRKFDINFQWKHFDWSCETFHKTGRMMPEDGISKLQKHDAIFFGAVGDLNISDDITLWGLRLEICQKLDQYANIRPSKYLTGIKSPLRNDLAKKIDWVIVRENTEGEYSGAGGIIHPGIPLELGTEISIFTKEGCRRIHEYAFKISSKRKNKHLTKDYVQLGKFLIIIT